CARWDFDYW
nr:immunoglobulin heavy chain junction region [Mus musculus]